MDALVVAIESKQVNFILDADIQSVLRNGKFRNGWSTSWKERIGDRRMLHLIQKC